MKHVITPHRPVRRALISLALVIALGLAFFVALDYGRWKAAYDVMTATGEQRSLVEEVQALRKQNRKLGYEVARLERVADIDRHAKSRHHQQLVELQGEVAALRKEIGFYREVVGATRIQSGPQVRGIRVRPLDGPGADGERFGFKLVMTHVTKDNNVASGKLRFNVRGELGGKPKAFGFADIVETGPESLSFKFKHFHLFEGTLRMPKGFEPRQIRLAVEGERRGKLLQEAVYDWAAVLN